MFQLNSSNPPSPRTSLLYSFLVFLAVLNPPIFFGLPSFDLFILRIFQDQRYYTPLDDPAVPLVALIVLFLAILSWRHILERQIAFQLESTIPVLLSLFFLTVGMIAFLSSGEVFAFFGAIQYAAIPLSYLVGRSVYRQVDLFTYVVISFFLYFFLVLAAFIYVHSQYGLSWFASLHRVRMAAPGLFVYIPAYFICLVYLSIGLAKSTGDFALAFVCTLLLTVVMFFSWSRASVVIGVITPALTLATIRFLRRKGVEVSGGRLISRPASFLLVASCVIVLIAPQFGLLAKRGGYVSVGGDDGGGGGGDEHALEFFKDMETSDMARKDFLIRGIGIWLEQPIFGKMFKPQEKNFSEGRLIPRKRVFQSHNQYLDILIKSGIIGLLLFVWFIVVCIIYPLKEIRKKRIIHNQRQSDLIIFSSLLAAVALAANFQIYITIWTTGIPIMFWTGYLISSWRKPETNSPHCE